MPSLVVIGPQIKEKQRGAQCVSPQPTGSKRPQSVRVNYLDDFSDIVQIYAAGCLLYKATGDRLETQV